MKTVSPGMRIRLGIIYQESGIAIPDLLDITALGVDESGNSILATVTLGTSVIAGEYYYDWETSSIDLEKEVKIFFKKGSSIVEIEEFYFDILEDSDGRMI